VGGLKALSPVAEGTSSKDEEGRAVTDGTRRNDGTLLRTGKIGAGDVLRAKILRVRGAADRHMILSREVCY